MSIRHCASSLAAEAAGCGAPNGFNAGLWRLSRSDAGDAAEAPRGGPRPTTPTAAALEAARRGIPDLIADNIKSETFFWSVELIPGTTPLLRSLLDESLQHLARHRPAFASVTWHVDHLAVRGPDGPEQVEHPAMALSARLQDEHGIPALMHLAAGRMAKQHVHAVLQACLVAGVTNILALRGDYKVNADADFPHASDLVHFIRKNFGDKFKIGVAGYPSGHPDSKSREMNFVHLKEKVDAGADFILTQMVSSAEEFNLFKQECDNREIRIPIIPGLFLIESYKMFEKLIRTCNILVSKEILDAMKQIKDENKEREYGKCLFLNLVVDLMKLSSCPGAHIFSMNRVTTATKVLDEARIFHDAIE
ncbi:5,10-methylenetetrahydrofolate reductase [Thrips palmi]|uniref:5,10-methylenetetrahydrofolate reductase n=1 Tax=Thrips palmi TaxID=161013 RepID=A0A6P9AAE5_THRPL|nr:5,10-methylenetetrahydrofolate reductase [Thrips palmi]